MKNERHAGTAADSSTTAQESTSASLAQNPMLAAVRLFFKKKDVWIYGTCNNTPARKHRKKGNVQMKLWKAGEQGHKEDYWHNFDSSWWPQFKQGVV